MSANIRQLLKDGSMSESVIDLERHRVQLEGNISKLQKSLRYWQTWEAEYEGLKEEILGLGDRHTHEQLVSEVEKTYIDFDVWLRPTFIRRRG